MTTLSLTKREKRFAGILILLFTVYAAVQYSVEIRAGDTLHSAAPTLTPVEKRRAERMSRLENASYSKDMLQRAAAERTKLLGHSVTVQVSDVRGEHESVTWTYSLSDHPELIETKSVMGSVFFSVNKDLLHDMLAGGRIGQSKSVVDIVIGETYVDAKGVTRVKEAPVAMSGFAYPAHAAASIAESLKKGSAAPVIIRAPYRDASVTLIEDGMATKLTLLGRGRSDYSNSPEERIWNVHKAFDERVNNILIKPGEKFSFVAALDAPVTLQKGWKESMGLFGGGAAPTPGAGICQAATTTYRAALLAGLKIVYKRNHSMFVDHYEPYGVGLDATVFPGVHDMVFKNDTAHPIVMQAYTEEATEEAFVNLYGIPDGRTVTLDGPYFNITKNRPKILRPLDWDEIGWVRTVRYADGSESVEPITATYFKGFFKSVKDKYANTPGTVLLHTKDPPQEIAATQVTP